MSLPRITHSPTFCREFNNPSAQNENLTSLSDFAQHVLRQICSQEWVLERCLRNASELCHLLMDTMMTTKQAQQLLHMICYAEHESNLKAEMDQKAIIVRILEVIIRYSVFILYFSELISIIRPTSTHRIWNNGHCGSRALTCN